MDDYVAANHANWEERVPHHLDAYGAAAFADDPDADSVGFDASLLSHHVPGGSVVGLEMVHLQCHIGLDTISWARRGAKIVGTDFSGAAIRAATDLATRASVDATFLEAANDEVPERLGRQVDVVYTSIGVISWLSDLETWGRTIAALLRPGGIFFLREGHPIAMAIDYRRVDDLLVVSEPYFPGAPIRDDSPATYAGDGVMASHPTTFTWAHSISDVLGALLGAGLRLESFIEHDHIPWRPFPGLVPGENGFVLPEHRERLPLSFSVVARKP